MAELKERKSLFSSTRNRVIVLFTATALIIAIAVGLFGLHSSNVDVASSAALNNVPGDISSIPGSLNQTIQYANLQQQQNIMQAHNAEKNGSSAIPTIIRTQAFGFGENIGAPGGSGGLDFTGLSHAQANNNDRDVWFNALKNSHCSKDSLRLAIEQGAKPADLKEACSCAQLKDGDYKLNLLHEVCSCSELKPLGVTILEFKNNGWNADELRACGFTACQTKGSGFSAAQMKHAGYTAGELKGAGFPDADIQDADGLPKGITAESLRKNGCNVAELIKERESGVSAAAIKRIVGCSAQSLLDAGYTPAELASAGYTLPPKAAPTTVSMLDAASKPVSDNSAATGVPAIPGLPGSANAADSKAQLQAENSKKLAEALASQRAQALDQKYQQQIQQRSSTMLNVAKQTLQAWKVVSKQQYEQTTVEKNKVTDKTGTEDYAKSNQHSVDAKEASALIEIGDVLFAVIDTAVNSDEPGPILATIVSGPLTGAKLIGSFTLPANADKMVISFNTLSVPGAAGSMSIHAFAIDPNTARTALSSETNHHYLTRYSALFASTFLEGFGNAFQSADTTITIGGTGGTTDTTVSNGIGRSSLENAVIGLATVGKAWGQVAQQGMSRPTTVQVYSGTGIGVLFTQDVKTI